MMLYSYEPFKASTHYTNCDIFLFIVQQKQIGN